VLELDVGKLKAWMVGYLSASNERAWTNWLSYLQLGGSWAMTLLTNLILLPIVVFYLLSDWDRLIAGVMSWVPPRLHKHCHSFFDECSHVLGQYLRGQLLEMVILAIFYSTGLWLFGLDLALPIGIFTGLAVCVPYLGYGLGLVIAALAGWLQLEAAHTLTMLVVVYGLGTLLEGLVLTPRLVGKRIGLNPLYVVFALMAFGSLFGLLGVFMALPVSAVMLVALRRFHRVYLHSHFYEDQA
jgi:predicted PurR-regulated permease PerM